MLIGILVLVASFFGLSYFQVNRLYWLAGLAAAVTFMLFTALFAWYAIVLAVLIVAAAVIAFVDPLRQQLISKPLMHFIDTQTPPMSETERVALEAGDVWWEKELFSGDPDWQQLLSKAMPQLTPAEQAFLAQETEELCAMLDDYHIVHHSKDLPPAVWQKMKDGKFFAMVIPKEYGGLGFSAWAHSAVIAKIGTHSVTAAVTVMVPNSLGPAELLMVYGTDKQKEHYLPKLATGEEVPCFALTAPEAGSDAAAIPDSGVVCKGTYRGSEVLGIRLNWNKRYITLAPVATVIGVAFHLFDPDHLISKKEEVGITLALVPADTDGVSTGNRHNPMGLGFMNGPLEGHDVFIPLDFIIGGPDNAGKGWSMLMESLSVGRAISLPSLSTASGALSFITSSAYAKVRKQFRVPIGDFEGVQSVLARIGGTVYSMDATRRLTATALTEGVKPALSSAIAKYHLTEMARLAINDGMDIHGGRAIQMGPRNYLAHAYQSLPIGITVEGANILTRNLIIFGQGALRCHSYLSELMTAAQHDDGKTFDQTLMAHSSYYLRNLSRSFIYGLTLGATISPPQKGKTAYYYRQLTRMSACLAWVSDVALAVLGSSLKRKESLSARLGDVLSHLYMASAVLKAYHDQESAKDDWGYVQWALQQHLNEIQEAFYSFLRNFPIRWLGKLMRFFIFPLGRSYSAPADKLEHQIAEHMQSKSPLRDRLKKLLFISQDAKEAVARIEQAFEQACICEPLFEKMLAAGFRDHQAHAAFRAHVINDKELEQIKAYELAAADAIHVDDFKQL